MNFTLDLLKYPSFFFPPLFLFSFFFPFSFFFFPFLSLFYLFLSRLTLHSSNQLQFCCVYISVYAYVCIFARYVEQQVGRGSKR